MPGSSLLAAFHHPVARRLAFVFAVVYFAQGMYYLPDQPVKFTLKETFGYSASQVATFFVITKFAWNIKPVYGLISDFVPLFGRRRKSYFLLTSGLAATASLTLALLPAHSPLTMGILMTIMGLGLAFNDVLTDALMVENGKRLDLTGGFQAIQWAAINAATIAVGVGGGLLTQGGWLHVAFTLAALFPLVSLAMAVFAIEEPRVRREPGQFQKTWRVIRGSLGSRDLWVVAGFMLFWIFSPSIGVPLFYYQTDVLKFSQSFIGLLDSLAAAAMIVGALAYGVFSKRWPLKRLLNVAVGIAVVSTLLFLLYRDPISAVAVALVYGVIYMFGQLAFLDLAAKACPRQAEGTFFALLMSVYNIGMNGSEYTGARLYDVIGYHWLIVLSAAFSALCFLLVPLVRVEEIEARARAAAG